MTKIILTIGLPASGKSTYARKLVTEDSTYVRLNRDDFRQMLFGQPVLDSQGEAMVTAAQHGAIDNALRAGFNVVVDDTNFFARGVRAILKIAHKHDAEVEFKDFTDVPLKECIRRDEIRREQGKSNFVSNAVGAAVIRGMYERYIKGRQLPLPIPSIGEYELIPYEPNPNLPDAVIVDIDGTIARMIDRGPFDWKRVGEDEPVQAVLDMVYALEKAGNIILFTSGRDGSCYGETSAWIHRYYHHEGKNWQLVMRAEKDNRPDWIIKAEIFDRAYRNNYHIKLVIDDRGQVVRMWRKLGLTVAQVAEGEF
jgi:predicted kinase